MTPTKAFSLSLCFCFSIIAEDVSLVEVPDYTWYAGCFGSASGNLMGYWDRHGFPNFYTGPTADGVAPLDSNGVNAGIRSMWASKAGFDGRPADQPGHIDDYWEYYLNDIGYSFESIATDPYALAGRPEHTPDSLGDFVGASQNKWSDLDGECSGNIDAYAFNFWDKQGARRENFMPPNQIRDIQSGLRAWARSRGAEANVFSQLAEFYAGVPVGAGFTFEDLKAEIKAGYPVMLFLQRVGQFSRQIGSMARANPLVHGMVAYGYVDTDEFNAVRYRTSWGSGDQSSATWDADAWESGLALRGVVGFHPLPQIKAVAPAPEGNGISIQWDGPSSTLRDNESGGTTQVHWYIVERSNSLSPSNFSAVTEPSTERQANVPNSGDTHTFYRVRLVGAPSPQ